MDLDLTVDSAAAERLLNAIERNLSFVQPALREVGMALLDYERDAFAQGGPGWSPLDPQTMARKSGGRVLVDSGALMESLTGIDSLDVDSDSVAVNSDVFYGRFHNTGTGRMPRRDPTPPPSAADARKFADVFIDALMGRML